MYTDGRRRCRRAGTGDPSLCNAHKIAFAETARRAGGTPGERIFDLFDTVLSGRKVSKKKIKNAWQDFTELVGEENVAQVQEQLRQRWAPHVPGAARRARASSAPPPDPEVERARREFAKAKQTLGFAPSEPITPDMVNDRKKQLAKRWHPDRPGGSLERMTEINAAADVLLRSAA